ncbi:MAG: D-alanyl-D-alanine carboxypeptidase, partial [Thiotrichaceae bacterium]
MNHKFLLGLGLFSLSLIGIAHAQSGLRIPVGAPQPAELALVRAEQPIAGLPDNIQALIAETKAPTANLSVYVRDLSADKPLVVHNVSVPRNPASTMKLLTTWAGLKLLGPNWTWKTQVWIRGQVQDGILLGDLILKGYGDPFLTDESFWQLLHDLRLKGLREIHGNLVVDNSYFDLSNEPATNFDDEPTKI